jgi:hypothetical protein
MEFDDIFFTAIAYALGDRVRSFEKTKGETFLLFKGENTVKRTISTSVFFITHIYIFVLYIYVRTYIIYIHSWASLNQNLTALNGNR